MWCAVIWFHAWKNFGIASTGHAFGVLKAIRVSDPWALCYYLICQGDQPPEPTQGWSSQAHWPKNDNINMKINGKASATGLIWDLFGEKTRKSTGFEHGAACIVLEHQNILASYKAHCYLLQGLGGSTPLAVILLSLSASTNHTQWHQWHKNQEQLQPTTTTTTTTTITTTTTTTTMTTKRPQRQILEWLEDEEPQPQSYLIEEIGFTRDSMQ